MFRHQMKDDEAGGDGLGHLATRKKLWRDSDGNIVNARRPYRQEGAKRKHLSSGEESRETNNSMRAQPMTLPPPPTSTPSAGVRGMEQYGGQGLLSDTWGAEVGPVQTDWAYNSSDFLCNADWGDQQCHDQMDSSCNLQFDDIFKPDTGKSLGDSDTIMFRIIEF